MHVLTLFFFPTCRYNNDLTCDSPVSITVDSLTCGNDLVCAFGDHVEATGSLSVSSAIPDQICLKTKACFMSLNFFCREYTQDWVDPCSVMYLQSYNTQCPNAGDYSFAADVLIPEYDELNLYGGMCVYFLSM